MDYKDQRRSKKKDRISNKWKFWFQTGESVFFAGFVEQACAATTSRTNGSGVAEYDGIRGQVGKWARECKREGVGGRDANAREG